MENSLVHNFFNYDHAHDTTHVGETISTMLGTRFGCTEFDTPNELYKEILTTGKIPEIYTDFLLKNLSHGSSLNSALPDLVYSKTEAGLFGGEEYKNENILAEKSDVLKVNDNPYGVEYIVKSNYIPVKDTEGHLKALKIDGSSAYNSVTLVDKIKGNNKFEEIVLNDGDFSLALEDKDGDTKIDVFRIYDDKFLGRTVWEVSDRQFDGKVKPVEENRYWNTIVKYEYPDTYTQKVDFYREPSFFDKWGTKSFNPLNPIWGEDMVQGVPLHDIPTTEQLTKQVNKDHAEMTQNAIRWYSGLENGVYSHMDFSIDGKNYALLDSGGKDGEFDSLGKLESPSHVWWEQLLCRFKGGEYKPDTWSTFNVEEYRKNTPQDLGEVWDMFMDQWNQKYAHYAKLDNENMFKDLGLNYFTLYNLKGLVENAEEVCKDPQN